MLSAMEGRVHPRSAARARERTRPPARLRLPAVDRVTAALCVVGVVGAVFYVWTAATSYPLRLDGSQENPYNLLASAFLHLHLSVGRPPAGLLRLPNPYNPIANSTFQLHPSDIHDFALYHGRLYLTWGPVPALVLVAPLHLLGLEPSTSVVAAVFAVAGLAFALATLRVVVRQLGGVAVWLCVVAALALTLSSVLPFMLRRPEVYEEALAGGFCFTMAGVWLAATALTAGRASLRRLAVASLCFGLAAGSRPPLGLAAVVLIPVYLALRGTLPRRQLVAALLAPLGVCVALLAAYNAARFGNPLEVGEHYQLAGIDQHAAHFAALSYLAPGAWLYLLSPPRASALFPFVVLTPPPVTYPGALPANYEAFELTAGLLPMAPVLLFLAALPWIWRRRPAWLGPLGAPLLILAGVGVAVMGFLAYEFWATTERYEVDFAALLLFGALAAWLALAVHLSGWRRWVVRIGGAVLAAWGCLTGLAIGFTGYADLLAVNHPATWARLESLTTPVSEAIAAVSGGPLLAEVEARRIFQSAEPSLTSLESPVRAFGVAVGEATTLTIVSPDSRQAALVTRLVPGVATGTGAAASPAPATVIVRDSGQAPATYTVPVGGENVSIPVALGGGVNHVTLTPLATPPGTAAHVPPASSQMVVVASLSLGGA
jgi:hypothetical protein